MSDQELETQVPLFRFLNKHKWVIIIPVLLGMLYFGIPGKRTYSAKDAQDRVTAGINGEILLSEIKTTKTRNEILNEIKAVQRNVESEVFLKELILRNDLFRIERANGADPGQLAQSLRKWVYSIAEDRGDRGLYFSVFILLDRQDQYNAGGINVDLNEEFGFVSGIAKISSFGSLSSTPPEFPNIILYMKLLFGFTVGLLISIFLIILRESPNLFYSKKTREEVFKPILSDWDLERSQIAANGTFLKRILMDVRFSMAFVSAMVRRNPLGDLVELGLRRVR